MYVNGDYVQGIDFDLIYLDLIGMVDEDKLKEVTEKKTEKLIESKVGTLVLDRDEFLKLHG